MSGPESFVPLQLIAPATLLPGANTNGCPPTAPDRSDLTPESTLFDLLDEPLPLLGPSSDTLDVDDERVSVDPGGQTSREEVEEYRNQEEKDRYGYTGHGVVLRETDGDGKDVARDEESKGDKEESHLLSFKFQNGEAQQPI